MATANEFDAELCAFCRRPVRVVYATVIYVTHAAAFALTHFDCQDALLAAYRLGGVRAAQSMCMSTHARLNLYDRHG